MDKYKETFETWNKIALVYQDKFMDLDIYNDTYDFICNSVKKNKANILEIGCGPGNITKYLLSKRPDYNIFGIDIAPNMIALAKKNNPNANFKLMDIRNISEIEGKYDAIVCGFCLPYISEIDSQKLLFDAKNLLNESGFLYLSFVEGDPNKSSFQIVSNGDRSYFYYHNLAQLKSQLSLNSFEDFKTFKVTYQKSDKLKDIHTIVAARKKIN